MTHKKRIALGASADLADALAESDRVLTSVQQAEARRLFGQIDTQMLGRAGGIMSEKAADELLMKLEQLLGVGSFEGALIPATDLIRAALDAAARTAQDETMELATAIKSLCENWGSGKQLTKTKAYQDACAILDSAPKTLTPHRT